MVYIHDGDVYESLPMIYWVVTLFVVVVVEPKHSNAVLIKQTLTAPVNTLAFIIYLNGESQIKASS